MDFVSNFIRFQQCKKFENLLRFDKVTKNVKVGTFLRHSVELVIDLFCYIDRKLALQLSV